MSEAIKKQSGPSGRKPSAYVTFTQQLKPEFWPGWDVALILSGDVRAMGEEFLRRLESLAIVSRRVVPGRQRAERRSKKRGSGVELSPDGQTWQTLQTLTRADGFVTIAIGEEQLAAGRVLLRVTP